MSFEASLKIFHLTMDGRRIYKLNENNLDIRSELKFANSFLKDLQLKVKPILDLAYGELKPEIKGSNFVVSFN